MFSLSKEELDKMAAVDVREVEREKLTDLREVKIDASLPVEEKLKAFAEQTGNVYVHRIGDYVVKVKFCEDGKTIDEIMEEYLRYLAENMM